MRVDGGLDLLDTYETGGDFPFGIALAPAGRALYVANTVSHTISAFAIESNGRLSALGQPMPTGADNPRGMSITPDGRYMFVTHDHLQSTEPDKVIGFAIGSDDSLEPLDSTTLPPCAGGFGTAISPDGQFLYISCLHSGQVAGFRIATGGTLTPVPRSPFDVSAGPEGIAITPDSGQLYVSHVGETRPDRKRAVSAFTIAADGELLAVSRRTCTAGRGPSGITTTPDGRHLYVANFDDGSVSAFGIELARSMLKIGTFPTDGTTPGFQSVAVRPNQSPTAAFSTNIAPAGDISRFDASASVDPDGRIARYHWDFGDDTVQPDGGPQPKHTYKRSGTYTITLTVIDDEDCSTDFVYTGQKALCNGSSMAQLSRTATVQGRFPGLARSAAPRAETQRHLRLPSDLERGRGSGERHHANVRGRD